MATATLEAPITNEGKPQTLTKLDDGDFYTAKPKMAIIQCADAGPLESLVYMLNQCGYACTIPNEPLRRKLKDVFGDKGLVLGPRDLTARMGYDPVYVPEIGPEHMRRADLYVDVKAHQVYDKVVQAWPNLQGKVLWYRINGGKPEHVINKHGDHGDEMNPPCPILTPNQWYKVETFTDLEEKLSPLNVPWYGRAYTCWPPFARLNEYDPKNRPTNEKYGPPICLIHNVNGWGYHAVVEGMRGLGVKVYGAGSPDGLIHHREVKEKLKTALCMVHLKSSDAPGYALYESLAAGCPVVCTGRLIWRCKMEALLQPGITCLSFDNRHTHDGLTERQVEEDVGSVKMFLTALSDAGTNRCLGQAGREQLEKVMWSTDRPEDLKSLREFMKKHYGE